MGIAKMLQNLSIVPPECCGDAIKQSLFHRARISVVASHFGHAGTNHGMVRFGEAAESFSLSPGERAGVRGKEAAEYPRGCTKILRWVRLK